MIHSRHAFLVKCHAFFLLLFSLVACDSEQPPLQEKTWIPGWQQTSEMSIARAGAAVVSYNNRIYMIGGVDGKNFLRSVEMSEVRHDGSLSAWKVVSNMPEARGFISAVIHNARVYVVGGGNGPYGKNLLNSVVSAPLLENGMLGEWREEKEKMLVPRRCSKIISDGNSLYALGGFGGALLDTVESTVFKANGELDKWHMQNNRLTIPRYVNEVKKVGDRIFALGGHHQSKGVGINQIEFASLKHQPLVWKQTTPMSQGRYAFSSTAYRKHLYAMGGISGSEYLNSIEKLNINDDIPLESWKKSSNLPEFMANFTTILIGDRIYLLGGSTRHKYMTSVWYAGFNKAGDIGFQGTQAQLRDYQESMQNQQSTESELPNNAIVKQVIETEAYTYILVDQQGDELWLAAPNMKIYTGDRIKYSEGVYMTNFYSKTLQRGFAKIVFVGTVLVDQAVSE